MSLELSPTLVISLGISALVIAAMVFGLYLGERGRRRDIQWWVGVQSAPPGGELGAEIDEARGEAAAERRAMERAEKHDIMRGLRQEAEAMGIPVDEAAIEEEALRIIGKVRTE